MGGSTDWPAVARKKSCVFQARRRHWTSEEKVSDFSKTKYAALYSIFCYVFIRLCASRLNARCIYFSVARACRSV